jgi:hypothetical protein
MRPVLRGFGAFLILMTVAACSGAGSGVQTTPASQLPQSSSTVVSAPDSAGTVSVVRAQSQTPYTYSAPWGGFTSNNAIILNPQGPCQHIRATSAGAPWPAFLKTLAIGTTVVVSGTPSYADSWSQANNCPTGGLVATNVSTATTPGTAKTPGSPTAGGTASSPAPPSGNSPPQLPPTGGASLPFGQLPPNYDPPASWRPYLASSPWNQRLSNPDNPTRDPNDGSKIQALFNRAFGSNIHQGRIGAPFSKVLTSGVPAGGFPYYFAKTSDPSVLINCTANWGTCQMQGKHFYVPAQAMAATNIDHHIIIVQPNGTELDAFEWGYGGVGYGQGGGQSPPWRNNETVNVGWGGIANLTNSDGWDLNTNGITAAGNDGLAGVIREPEIASGTINHALSAVIYCSPTATPVYPALHSSNQRNCNGFSMSQNQIVATGNRLWIDLTDNQINALSIRNAQKTILHALHDYGAFVIDYNGYDPVSFGGLESQLPGYIYGADVVGSWAMANLPLWYSQGGVSWHDTLSDSDMNSIVQPHLHVLNPCVNTGYPNGRC